MPADNHIVVFILDMINSLQGVAIFGIYILNVVWKKRQRCTPSMISR
jgi:hypothetical protein